MSLGPTPSGDLGSPHPTHTCSVQVKHEPSPGRRSGHHPVSDVHAAVAAAATADVTAIAAAATKAAAAIAVPSASAGSASAAFDVSLRNTKLSGVNPDWPVISLAQFPPAGQNAFYTENKNDPVASPAVRGSLTPGVDILSSPSAAVGIVPTPRMSLIERGDTARPHRSLGKTSLTQGCFPSANTSPEPSASRGGGRSRRAKRRVDGDYPQLALSKRSCTHGDCQRRPTFGFPGDPHAAWCKSHKVDGQVDIVSRRCERKGCTTFPSFRFAGERGSRFCAAHKLPGMEDCHRLSRFCKFGKGCKSNPSFGFEGGKRISCARHRTKEMVNLNSVRCQGVECNRIPNFGLPGHSPSSCASHRSEGMVNVVSKRCEGASCERIPSYNFDQPGAKAVFCAQHKANGMVNVRHPRCAHSDCRRQPSFGVAGASGKGGGKLAIFCKEHKTPEMVDVKNTPERKLNAKKIVRERKQRMTTGSL
ncbi:unnamed protein product [Ascophyllum nodosum]